MEQVSVFFKLPGEIRNTIYTYILTAHRHLAYQPVWFGNEKSPKPTFCLPVGALPPCQIDGHGLDSGDDGALVEWNQLKYVNRQMRKETLYMETRLNAIAFKHKVGDSTAPIHDFMATCLRTDCLTSITLFGDCLDKLHQSSSFKEESSNDAELAELKVYQFCKTNPHIKVEYRDDSTGDGWGEVYICRHLVLPNEQVSATARIEGRAAICHAKWLRGAKWTYSALALATWEEGELDMDEDGLLDRWAHTGYQQPPYLPVSFPTWCLLGKMAPDLYRRFYADGSRRILPSSSPAIQFPAQSWSQITARHYIPRGVRRGFCTWKN